MIELILFIIGVIGLTGGNLTISKNHDIKGRRARIAGLILILPLPLSYGILDLVSTLAFNQIIPPLMETPLLRWFDLLPAILGILGAFIYLNSTDPNRKPGTLQFWFVATIPAICLYIATNLTVLFQFLFHNSMRLPLPFDLGLELPDLIIGIIIPSIIAFTVNLLIPVVTNRLKAIQFAIPVFVIYVYYYVIMDWILPGILSIAYPGDTPGAGYQDLLNGMAFIPVSLLFLLIVAFVGWFAARIRRPV